MRLFIGQPPLWVGEDVPLEVRGVGVARLLIAV
jgi:hypothetical protein